MEDDNATTEEAVFFVEREEVLAKIASVCREGGCGSFEATFEYLVATLGKYQEQPTLLNSSLGDMMSPLTTRMLELVETRGQQQELDAVCKVLRLISRVRGFKHVVKLFPHEVAHLEACLSVLKTQDRKEHGNWETRYVFLTWLCLLCLIPFDICSMDSTLSNTSLTSDNVGGRGVDGEVVGQQAKSGLVRYIVELCSTYLSDTGPTREAASACLSALLTRPDMETDLLTDFITTSCARMTAWAQKGQNASNEFTSDSFGIIGVLHCISQIFKKGHRSRVLAHAPTVLKPCLMIAAQSNQTLTRKLTCKLAQRIGMTFLPPRVAVWRYQRGQRSLLQNLQLGAGEKQQERGEEVGNMGGDEDDDFEAPEELENIIDHLLNALHDRDTVVRWNSAKGIGRVTMRLSKSLADDIVGAVLELCEDKEDDSAWHGACLALAELTRRGLLLPDRLSEVVPIIQRAIHFDVLRGQHSVGAHVRDAACYVCWAFARAYTPQVMRPFINDLTSAMLITALYDREINCRRAASAAFQENVGRQGNENFPYGIEIISIADYFSLGNRSHAYLHIAPAVAKLAGNFLHSLTEHLIHHMVSHWDDEVRVLASQALARLSVIDSAKGCEILQNLLKMSFSQTVSTRHGSVLAVGEVLLALVSSRGAQFLQAELNDSIVDLVLQLDKARLYRGRGGEILRHASCALIESIARCNLTMDLKKKVSLVEFLNENLRQPHEYIQKAASSALRNILFSYFASSEGDPSERLRKLTTLKYLQGLATEENVAATRGYALALGALPVKLATQPAGTLKEVLNELQRASGSDRLIAGEADAETRRNAVDAATELVERLIGSFALGQEELDIGLDLLFKACDDYSVDKRGDTGSWSRIVAMEGLERLVYASSRNFDDQPVFVTVYGPATIHLSDDATGNAEGGAMIRVLYPACSLGHRIAIQSSTADESRPGSLLHSSKNLKPLTTTQQSHTDLISSAILTKVVCAFLEQLAGRLDAVRDVAGNCLQRFLSSDANKKVFLRVPEAELLSTCLAETTSLVARQIPSEMVNWANSGHAFPFLARLLDSVEYFHSIIKGFVLAVGGLTESVVKESSAALLEFCRSKIKSHQQSSIQKLATSLVDLFSKSANSDRVILPLLKTLECLLRNGVFDSFRSIVSSDSQQPQFSARLLASVKEESNVSSNVIKIKACIDVLLHLLQFEDPIRPSALKALVVFLGHKYPSVRKHAAEALYVQFLSDSNSIGPSVEEVASRQQEQRDPNKPSEACMCGLARDAQTLEKAQDILANTSWETSVPAARDKRQELCTLLDLKMQKKEPAEAGATQQPRPKATNDELDSYEYLVRTAGY
jgi:hypothetical protein